MRMLDRSTPIPFYYQLQEILKEEIEQGTWQPGDLIPSESELATLFGISRTVIRKALDILEADGQVYRVRGKGTLVAAPKFRYEATSAAGSWARNPAQGRTMLQQVIDTRRVPVGGHVGRLLKLPPERDVYELTFIQSVEQVPGQPTPASLSQMYLRMDASPRLEAVVAEGRTPRLVADGPDVLAQLSERYGLTVAESQVTVEATLVNEFESELLGVRPQTPVFLLSSVDLSADGTPVAFTRTVVRSDHFRFSVLIRRVSEATSPSDAPSFLTAGKRQPGS